MSDTTTQTAAAVCHFFDDASDAETGAPVATCATPPIAEVEPAPEGQFAPTLVCGPHIVATAEEHAFHLGTEWFVRYTDGRTRTFDLADAATMTGIDR